MDSINEKVGQIIIGVKKSVEPHLVESNLITDGLLDSLDIMNLIMKLEEAFDIEIDPEDVLSENFESVDKIVELIKKCQR